MGNILRFITDLARYAVGILFIFSGIVKANDPLGFSYKLEEYFEEFAKLGQYVGFLEPFFHLCYEYALPQAIFIVILEVVLGVGILVRYRVKLMSWLLLLLIVFFTALTFASAYFGIVKTCGCFGDAIPLTAWESFYKDLILLILILIIFFRQKSISLSETNINDFVLAALGLLVMLKMSHGLDWYFPFNFTLGVFILFFGIRLVEHIKAPLYVTALSFLTMGFFTFYTYSYLPVRDFLAYAEGKSIAEGMKGVPDKLKYYYILKNKATGELEEFEKFPENYQEKYEYVEARTVVVEKGVEPAILDFSIITADGEDLTDDFLSFENYTFFWISYDLDQSLIQVQPRANDLAKALMEEGHRFVGLTASVPSKTLEFKQAHNTPYEYLYCDQTVLKTIMRSNPGLMLIREGVVIAKWHANDLPSIDQLRADFLRR
jgi:uncharacterized membrane protein YphA (DoxX/SURF4 family)